ncbi:MAG: hypothetical protein COA82_12320 [Alkaliphilus sp.]|nr:MAG: hypothetical protein COA82_12320 [Alkaliphilus sp.]
MKKNILLFSVVLVVFFLVGCGDSETTHIELKTQVSADHKYIYIQNKDDFVWENVEITINKEYKMELDFLARGKSSLEIFEFTRKNGERFDPALKKIKDITIYVPETEEREDGFWLGRFN